MTIKDRFETIITQKGLSVIWRQELFTLDSRHGTVESRGSVTDTSITVIVYPVSPEEVDQSSTELQIGDVRLYVSSDSKLQAGNNDGFGDFVFMKDENVAGFTTVSGTSATQAVVSGDQRSLFAVDGYVSISDSSNTALYRITAVSYSSGDDETTVTVAFTADPGGSGDTLFRAVAWEVMSAADWPSDGNATYRVCVISKRLDY